MKRGFLRREIGRLLFVLVAAAFSAAGFRAWDFKQAAPQEAELQEASRGSGVDVSLLGAVVASVHHLDTANGMETEGMETEMHGLMGIRESLARKWALAHAPRTFMLTDLRDAQTNLRIGAWGLAEALKYWSGRDRPVVFALAEFRIGRAALLELVGEYGTAGGVLRHVDARPRKFIMEVLKRFGD